MFPIGKCAAATDDMPHFVAIESIPQLVGRDEYLVDDIEDHQMFVIGVSVETYLHVVGAAAVHARSDVSRELMIPTLGEALRDYLTNLECPTCAAEL